MFKREKKVKSNVYFDSFPALAHFSVECGEAILDFMNQFDPKKLEELKDLVEEKRNDFDERRFTRLP